MITVELEVFFSEWLVLAAEFCPQKKINLSWRFSGSFWGVNTTCITTHRWVAFLGEEHASMSCALLLLENLLEYTACAVAENQPGQGSVSSKLELRLVNFDAWHMLTEWWTEGRLGCCASVDVHNCRTSNVAGCCSLGWVTEHYFLRCCLLLWNVKWWHPVLQMEKGEVDSHERGRKKESC